MKLINKIFSLFLFLLLTLTSLVSFSQEDPLEKVQWDFSIEQNGCEATIIAKAIIIEHWHIYGAHLPEGSFSLPTELILEDSPNYKKIDDIIEPEPEILHDDILDEDLYLHSATVEFKQKIKILNPKGFKLKGVYSFQTCDDTHCLPPFDGGFEINIKPCENLEFVIQDQGDKNKIDLPEDKVNWNISIEQNGCEATIIAQITCEDQWHIYAVNKGSNLLQTKLETKASSNYEIDGDVIEPEPKFYHDKDLNEDIYQHSNSFVLKRKIKILNKNDFTINGTFSFVTCQEKTCLPPHDTDFELKVKGCDSNDNKSLIAIFFIAFLSGFAALLTPCVFPMIPMTVSFFTKQSKSKAQGIKNAIIYGFSIIVIYVLLGTVVTAIFGSDALYAMSTNVYFNIIFFIILIVFAISFLGAFEITLPNSWVNKADSASDKGGLIGIFFMATTLALVSFSCTGPIVGTLLVKAATMGGIGPVVGMLGFSLAIALPFALFAAFPGWMNSLPKSGGWLNSVKVVLGFLELALAFKFLSNADLVMQAHYLEREVFLAIWIGIFSLLALYLFGFIHLPHDSPITNLSVGRALLGLTTLIFVIYLIPGLWGAPLKLISAFPPPMEYSESPKGLGNKNTISSNSIQIKGTKNGPQGLSVFHDLDKGLAYAKKIGKPAFLDFTGRTCVNCRRMEQSVWGEAGIINILRDSVVIISLEEDDPTELPEKEREVIDANGNKKTLKTLGDKWKHIQAMKYQTNAQPYYVMYDDKGNDLANGSADYEHHSNPDDFQKWLEKGLKLYKEVK